MRSLLLCPAMVIRGSPGGLAVEAADVRLGQHERLLLALLLPLTLLRWGLAASFELCGDEAYYWLWSRHLDVAYYSKGPAVALVIALSTHLFGDSVIGVRAFSPVFAALSTTGVFVLGRMLYDSRTGFWAAVVFTLMPICALGAVLQTIDPISVCCWAWSLVVLARIAAAPSLGLWVGAGLLIGAGALAKYTNLFLLPSFVIFCLISVPHRSLLKAGGFWVMLAVVLACLAPVLAWQTAHGWVTVTHLKERGAFGVVPRLSLVQFAIFASEQLAVSWPVLPAVGLAIPVLARRPPHRAAWRAPASPPGFPPLTFLLATSLPLLGSYAAMAWILAGEPNWVVPAYTGLAALAAAGGVQRWDRTDTLRRRRLIGVCLGIGALLNLLVSMAPLVPLPGDAGLKARVQGAQQLATHVAEVQAAHHASFLIGDHYWVASLVSFYTPDHPAVFTPTTRMPRNELFYWPGYRQTQRQNQSAVYIARYDVVPQVLKDQFAKVTLLEMFMPRYVRRPLRPYYLFLCEGFRPSVAG